MLQRIARGPLKSHHILINTSLRNDVVVKEIIVGECATQVVIVPGNFSFYPGLTLSAESQTRFFPLLAGICERARSALAVFGCERFQVESAGHVAVEKG